jgi:hypothetical protein
MKLSAHFTLAELCHSQTADRLGIANTPDTQALRNLTALAAGLEVVRELVQSPIVVSSGYRSPAVNKLVGGASDSQHMTGSAADITTPGFGSPSKLMDAIVLAGVSYDQCILEFASATDPSKGWVHISFSARNRRQALIIDRSGVRAYA